ncbi:Os11g0567900 [Oryza sativa Japonica Group]|uniref:Os11g0567900 protein n=1 Tax=Oryza sativa subsp. japonica TaxID=39947 RepID=A0A0P0Y3T1_ORYSJ|nr:Os11g0567900 [Oryza sativa Japonica Group]
MQDVLNSILLTSIRCKMLIITFSSSHHGVNFFFAFDYVWLHLQSRLLHDRLHRLMSTTKIIDGNSSQSVSVIAIVHDTPAMIAEGNRGESRDDTEVDAGTKWRSVH